MSASTRLVRLRVLPATVIELHKRRLAQYRADPSKCTAYSSGEYSAVVVPKIMSLPCYKREVGRDLTKARLELLRDLKEDRRANKTSDKGGAR